METKKDVLSDLNFQKNFGYELATPWSRFVGALLESIIVFFTVIFVFGHGTELAVNGKGFSFQQNLSQTAMHMILGAVLYPLWSGNLGHRILGMKVISSEDGSDQNKPGVGALRELLKSILGWLIIPSIWLLWDEKRQNLYDKASKTLVVYKK